MIGLALYLAIGCLVAFVSLTVQRYDSGPFDWRDRDTYKKMMVIVVWSICAWPILTTAVGIFGLYLFWAWFFE